MIRPSAAALALFVGVVLANGAAATTGQEEASAEEQEVISDEQYQELTEEALPSEQAEEEEAGPSPREEIDPAAIRARWDQGFRLERNDKRFRMKIGGRFMYDQAWIQGDGGISEAGFDRGYDAEIRRGWIDIAGVFGGRFIYRAQVDLAGNSAGDDDRNRYLRQVYVGWTVPGTLNGVRAGYTKEPFSIGEQTSSLSTLFMERPLPMIFTPNYNLGILLNGQPVEKRVSWSFGAFRYSGGSGDRDRLDLTARLVYVPYATEEDRQLLHIGASYSHQFRDDFELRYRRRPEAHLADRYVDTGEMASDGVDLYSAELAAKWGSAFLQSELIGSRVNRAGAENVDFWSAYLQLGYFLTGEERPYQRRFAVFGRVRPRTQFDWRAGTWGAWEVGARYSHLDLDDEDIRGGTLNDFSLGLNWYIFPHVRIMLNYVHAHLNGVGSSDIYQVRYQIDY